MHNRNEQKTILILGAGSDMAVPLIDMLFQQWQSSRFYLLARRTDALQPLAEAGRKKGHTVEIVHYDAEAPMLPTFSDIEICITYIGWLPPDNSEPEKTMLLNYTGIEKFLKQLVTGNVETLQHVIITGSIAGVRVRPANRAYGQAKAALHRYALQLQQQWKRKIAVTLVIPGYVQTKMLADTKTPAALTLSPQALAIKYFGWLQSKPAIVYSQPVWHFIALILKLLPPFVINRMKK